MYIPLHSFAATIVASTICATAVTALPYGATQSVRRNASQITTWDPPSDLVTPLTEVWNHEVSTYTDALGFKNYGYDQIMATNGSLNYCVRWESNSTATVTDRQNIESALQRSLGKWMDWLVGFEDFPFTEINVKVVGWAVKSADLLEGDTSGIQVYTDQDESGIPQCAESCGRFFHQDGNYDGCEAGADRHYDQSLWLTDGFDGGAGGDWGQRVGKEYIMENLNEENLHVLEHEMGHTFALDDFYDWTPTGITSFIMNAGSSMVITDFDGWMLRDWWRHLKSRYSL